MKTDTTGINIRLLLRCPIQVLAVILVMTVCAGYGIKNLKTAADPLASMYPLGHPYISTLEAIKAMTPESRLLVGILKVNQGDIYNKDTLKKIDGITRGLLAIEGIIPTGVTSLTRGMMHYYNTVTGLNIESVMGTLWPETSEEFQALRRRVATNPMGPGRYVSYDGTAVMITAKLADMNQISRIAYDQLPEDTRPVFDIFKQQQSGQFNARLVKALDALKAQEDDDRHTLLFMGQEVLTHQLTQMGIIHISTAAGIMFGIILLLLLHYFRSVIGVVTPLISMAMAVVWGLGLYGWAGIELNPLMILFPFVLALLTLALSTLIITEYQKNCRICYDRKHSIEVAFSKLPVKASILFAGAAMGGMAITPVPVMRDLAAMGLFWMVGAYVAVIILSPVVLVLLPEPSGKGFAGRQLPSFPAGRTSVGKYAGAIIGLAVLAGGVLVYPRLKVGGNIPGISYIRDTHPWSQCFNLFAEKFMGPQQLLVYVEADNSGGLTDPRAMNAIGDFSRYIVNQCGARDSIAFDMMVKMCRWTMMDGNPKWQTLPLTQSEIQGLAGTVFEQGGVEDFIDPAFTRGIISPFFPGRDAESIDAYADKMQAYIDTHPTQGLTFRLGGGLLGMTKPQNDAVRLSCPGILVIVMLAAVVFGMVWLSPVRGIAVALSLGCAQAALWLVMAAMGLPISLSVVGATAASVAIGFILGAPLSDVSTVDTALFAGVLVFTAGLPFILIGMKFQADMLLIFSVFAAAELIMGMLIIPVFISKRRAK